MTSLRKDELHIKELITSKEINTERLIVKGVDLLEYINHKLNNIKLPETVKGEKGEKGDVGPRGPQGIPGETVVGPQGIQGIPGKKGERGYRGKNGYESIFDFPELKDITMNKGDSLVWNGEKFDVVRFDNVCPKIAVCEPDNVPDVEDEIKIVKKNKSTKKKAKKVSEDVENDTTVSEIA